MGCGGHSPTPTRSMAPRLSRQGDRVLRAVALRVGGLPLVLTGDVFDKHDRMPNLVGVKDFRCQRIAAPMPFAPICIDGDAGHVCNGKVNGSDTTDRSAAVKANSVPGLIS
jgi:hypothetical protein